MKLENQVCTLLQAKRLKELGVGQWDSLFCFYELRLNGKTTFPVVPVAVWRNTRFEDNYEVRESLEGYSKNEVYASYTVAELGAMLIPSGDEKYGELECVKTFGDDGFKMLFTATVLAEILIEMLEKGFITATDCNNRLTAA